MPNVSFRMDQAQEQYTNSARETDACLRSVRDGEMHKIRALYDELKAAQEAQALYHCASILAALCKIVSAGFDPNDGVGRAISGVASTLEGIGGFKIKLDDGSITKMQGLIEQVRTHMQNTEKEDDELKQLLLQVERMLDDAKAKADRSLSAPFTSTT